MTRGADLEQVRREGKRIRTTHLEVRAVASLLPHPRVGIVVPRYKHTAVERNLLKRRLRELVRRQLLPTLRAGAPLDVVLRSAPQAYGASFEALGQDVQRAGEQLRRMPLAPPASQPTPPSAPDPTGQPPTSPA